MPRDPNFHHSGHSDSYVDEFNTSQGNCEIYNDRDATSSVKEEREAFESPVGMPSDSVSDDETAYEMCFSPSYITEDLSSVFNHKDSSPVSNKEHVHLDSTRGTFTCHNRDVSPVSSDEEIPPGVNLKEWCYRDPNQDVHPAIQQPEEQVSLDLSQVDASQILLIFFEHFHRLFF